MCGNEFVGTCHFKHDVLNFDRAIWSYEITASNLDSGSFTTASADGSTEAFVLPAVDVECSRLQEFELRYIREGEVIGRSIVLPIGM